MGIDKKPSLKDQLIEARAKIVTQLEEISARSSATWLTHGRQAPDNRHLISQLEGQLREIETILETVEEPNA